MLFFFLSVLNNLYSQFNHEWEPTGINYNLCILADHLSKGHLIHPPASLKEESKSSPSRHKCNCLVEKKMTFIFPQRDATPISAGWAGIWRVLHRAFTPPWWIFLLSLHCGWETARQENKANLPSLRYETVPVFTFFFFLFSIKGSVCLIDGLCLR